MDPGVDSGVFTHQCTVLVARGLHPSIMTWLNDPGSNNPIFYTRAMCFLSRKTISTRDLRRGVGSESARRLLSTTIWFWSIADQRSVYRVTSGAGGKWRLSGVSVSPDRASGMALMQWSAGNFDATWTHGTTWSSICSRPSPGRRFLPQESLRSNASLLAFRTRRSMG